MNMQCPRKWVKLRDLARLSFICVKEKPGVYLVRLIKNGKPLQICRFGNIDRNGIVYIGATSIRAKRPNLRKRIRDLWRSLEQAYKLRKMGKRWYHTLGITLVYSSLINHVDIDDFEIWWKTYDQPVKTKYGKIPEKEYADMQEKAALLEYTRRYLEPPPLNLQLGRQYYAIVGIGIVGKSRCNVPLDPDIKNMLFSSDT